MSKLHSTCPWESFEKVFFGRINLIYLIGTLSETLFYFCWKIFGRDSHNYNLHVRRKMLMETSLFLQKVVFYHFWTFTEVHQPSVKFFSAGLWKCKLCVHRNVLTRSLSLGNLFVTTFFTNWLNVFQSTVNCFSIVLLKLHSTYLDEGSELEKNENFIIFLFFGFWDNFFQVFSKFCRWCCQNWILHTRRSASWKISFFEKITIFYHCRTLKEKRLDFRKNFLAWMSKLHSKCP